MFPRYFEFSQTSTSVSITYGNTVKNVFYFFYKITRRKVKRGNRLLYQSVDSPYCSWWRIRWRESFHACFPNSTRNTAFSQSKLTFSKYYIFAFNIARSSISKKYLSLSIYRWHSEQATNLKYKPKAIDTKPLIKISNCIVGMLRYSKVKSGCSFGRNVAILIDKFLAKTSN